MTKIEKLYNKIRKHLDAINVLNDEIALEYTKATKHPGDPLNWKWVNENDKGRDNPSKNDKQEIPRKSPRKAKRRAGDLPRGARRARGKRS